jgi:hypothetical protein
MSMEAMRGWATADDLSTVTISMVRVRVDSNADWILDSAAGLHKEKDLGKKSRRLEHAPSLFSGAGSLASNRGGASLP